MTARPSSRAAGGGARVTRFVAFLRAVNVGGRTVPMAELVRVFTALGFERVETFIASGNVIFEAAQGIGEEHERRIEGALLTALGYEVTTFVRTIDEVAAVAAYRPFDAEAIAAAGALNVGFLRGSLDAARTRALMALRTDIDDFQVEGREIYWLCRKKQSESTFSNARCERALKVPVTLRGVNTIARLVAKYSPAPVAVSGVASARTGRGRAG